MTRLLVVFLLMIGLPALAVQPGEILDDPALEDRARALSREIRCMVCRNESIDSSNAELAQDMRRLVRNRLVAGDSDGEIREFLQSRYGDVILMRPPVRSDTLLLWLAPALVLLIGGGVAVAVLRSRRQAGEPAPLSAEEEARLREVTGR